MIESICGLDCAECELRDTCGGCVKTGGSPFGGNCVIASCCRSKKLERCGSCAQAPCELKNRLTAEFNALGIEDMEPIAHVNALASSYVNLEFTLPNGKKVKFFRDDDVILGNQTRKIGSDRCYGLAADENFLLACEYGENGSDPEIVVYRRRNRS